MSKQSKARWVPAAGSQHIYELEVAIFSGPVTKDFAKANPVV